MTKWIILFVCDAVAIALAYWALRLYGNGSLFWAAFLMVFAMDVVVLKGELLEIVERGRRLVPGRITN
jgi:hypothetical protein